jgi:6-pyruvoyltetrahydropterin/6-carboxytetrahydropterin synthase
MMLLTAEIGFSSAHRMEKYPGNCQHLHGHNYKLFLTVAGEPDPETEMVIDFVKMKEIVQERVLNLVDHRYLNDVISYPTSENIVKWIWDRLDGHLQGLYELKLYEQADCCVTYRGPGKNAFAVQEQVLR